MALCLTLAWGEQYARWEVIWPNSNAREWDGMGWVSGCVSVWDFVSREWVCPPACAGFWQISLCSIMPAWGVQQLHLSVSGCWKVNRVYTLTQRVTTAEHLCGCSVGSWWWFSSRNFQSCGSYTMQANIVHLVYICLTVRWHHLKYSSQGGAVVSTASSHHGGCRMFCAVPVWVPRVPGWNCQWMSSFKLSVLIFDKKATNLPNADKPTALFHWIILHLTVDIDLHFYCL